MPEPEIDLTQLRAQAESGDAYIYGWDMYEEPVPPSLVLLALIDTAEAATALCGHLVMIGGGQKVEAEYLRLRESLARYKKES